MNLRATFVAAAIATTSVLLLWGYLRRFEEEASGGPKVGVLMVMKSLEPGALIRAEDLSDQWIPRAYVEPRAVRIADRGRVANLRTSVPLKAQNTLQWTDLVTAGEDQHDMSSLVQPGMRAMIVHAEGSSAALVNPGNRVDVLGTFTKPNTAETRTSVVLLQNVLVLGKKADSDNKRNASSNELLLSVTLAQAEVLNVAADKGKLSVALRSEADVRVQGGLPEFSSTGLLEPDAKPAPKAPSPKGPVSVR